jgi:hypothetical protein
MAPPCNRSARVALILRRPQGRGTGGEIMAGNDSQHRQGHSVDTVDQLSSVVLLGLAAAGGAVAVILSSLVS